MVVDGQAYSLTTAVDSNGKQRIFSSQGKDITGDISGGELGGMLQARDQAIPIAGPARFACRRHGHCLKRRPRDGDGPERQSWRQSLLVPVAGVGAASSMALAFTDPALLAASSDGTSGGNGNIANLSAVANQNVTNGLTPSGGYSNLVFQAGLSVSDGNAELNASTAMLQQLQQQQSSVSGVSLDEEASNLLLYQRAYQAAAQAITAVNQMLQVAINMGAST